MILFAAALYLGRLWNNRGASEYQQLLASIRSRERVKHRHLFLRASTGPRIGVV